MNKKCAGILLKVKKSEQKIAQIEIKFNTSREQKI